MAAFTISAATGFNMEALQLFNLFEKPNESRTAAQYRTFVDANTFTEFNGAGLTYGGMFPDTTLTGGTVASIVDKVAGATVFSASGFSMPAVNLYNFYVAGNTSEVLGEMLSQDDIVTGGAGDDKLFSVAGNDKIVGGLGADYMAGGLGNDIYGVDNAGDLVVELSDSGADTVESSIDFALNFGLENLTLTGVALNGTGNSSENVIIGNAQNNVLDGQTGNDTISGGLGNDQLFGSHGSDTLNGGGGNDVLDGGTDVDVLNGDAGNDTLFGAEGIDTLNGGADNDFLDGGAGIDAMNGGAGNDVFVVDNQSDTVTDSAGVDRVECSHFTYTLGATIENLTLLIGAYNGAGNALANVIKGNVWDNELNGEDGNDTLYGGLGIDYLYGGVGLDTLHGEDGNDVLSGGEDNDILWGGGGSDLLVGQSGIDIHRGGAGDDTYNIENAGDVVFELVNEGVDTVATFVSYTLTVNVENLTLAFPAGAIDGTGNTLNNVIVGNNSANVINGWLGADTMRGGGGADSYIVENLGDLVFEAFAPGEVDLVTSSVDFRLSANVENLNLTGAALKATGNNLANVLNGTGLNNIIDGKQGADTMTGFNGNDTYYVDNGADQVLENAGVNTGIDTVIATVTYTLAANVENLTIGGAGTTAGNGNALNNTIVGNAAANSIEGKDGDDILEGGLGQDTLFGGVGFDDFRYKHLAADQDNVFDFTAGQDDIMVSAAAFGGGLIAGGLAANRLVLGPVGGSPTANQAFGQFLYDVDDGRLIWDQNGTGAGGDFHIATLNFGLGQIPAISTVDFLIIA